MSNPEVKSRLPYDDEKIPAVFLDPQKSQIWWQALKMFRSPDNTMSLLHLLDDGRLSSEELRQAKDWIEKQPAYSGGKGDNNEEV